MGPQSPSRRGRRAIVAFVALVVLLGWRRARASPAQVPDAQEASVEQPRGRDDRAATPRPRRREVANVPDAFRSWIVGYLRRRTKRRPRRWVLRSQGADARENVFQSLRGASVSIDTDLKNAHQEFKKYLDSTVKRSIVAPINEFNRKMSLLEIFFPCSAVVQVLGIIMLVATAHKLHQLQQEITSLRVQLLAAVPSPQNAA